MTEEEWLTCEEPTRMFATVKGRRTERKLRLFAVACCRRIALLRDSDQALKALALAEQFADGQACKAQRRNAHDAVLFGPHRPPVVSNALIKVAFEAASRTSESAANRVAQIAVQHFLEPPFVMLAEREVLRRSVRATEHKEQAALLRDIFGNPFRPLTFSPEWRTETVLLLAQQMYESRDFSAMPILADALQDTRCDNEDIIKHCQGDGPHVRGCWVVDLVLGKE